MKTIFGENGVIIVLAIILIPLIQFIFGSGNNQLIGMLDNASPQATVESRDNFELVEDIGDRENPTITAIQQKFKVGYVYNLLDYIKAENADKEVISVDVVKVLNPAKQDITADINLISFQPTDKGVYEITYHAEETYKTVIKKTDKIVSFVSD